MTAYAMKLKDGSGVDVNNDDVIDNVNPNEINQYSVILSYHQGKQRRSIYQFKKSQYIER